MHSSLQYELRLTHRLVRNSCRQCRQRVESPRRSLHQGRNLQSSQGARNDADSQPTPPSHNENQNNTNDPPIAPNVPYTRHPFPSSQHNAAAQGGPPPDDPNSFLVSGFHGSLRNRWMRTRTAKELPRPQIEIPEWFIEQNVSLLGEGALGPEARTSITYLGNDSLSKSLGTQRPRDTAHREVDGSVEPQRRGSDTTSDLSEPAQLRMSSPRRRELQKQPRYWIESTQNRETQLTASGLMVPSRKPEYDSEPANKTCHLCLRYAAKDGELLLDDYIQNLAVALGCDLMALDVQDIAEMIAASQQSPDIVAEARHMSYEVFWSMEADFESDNGSSFFYEGEEDMEDDGDSFENGPMGSSPRMPIMMGKPIAIDLSNLFNIFGGKRNNRMADTKPLRNQASTSDLVDKSRSPTTPYADLVERLLSVISEKRHNRSVTTKTSQEPDMISPDSSAPQTMIHIKDAKMIQETSIGGQFLSEIFAQIERRRKSGERIIVVGTECSAQDQTALSARQIEDMQKLKNYDVSRTIVLTPIVSDNAAKMALRQDRRLRFATINMRHIFETIRLKQVDDPRFDVSPGFWKTDEWLGKLRQGWALTDLGKKLLNFSDVHRIATVLAGLSSGSHDMAVQLNMSQDTKDFAVLELVNAILRDSDSSKVNWADLQLGNNKPESKISISAEDLQVAKVRATATKHEKKLLTGVIESSKITTTFADVHAPLETIDALQTLTSLSLVRPDAFSYGVLASDKIPGLLLYGPPGTGKTLLAKAVAKESGARMLEVSAADINDMYVGEGEKNVKALFSLAKKLSPCVVFLDEADAMFSARATSGRRVSHRELLNQFLKEWDGMSNDSGSAFIMVATNRPMDLDDAVLRRLPRRLLVDLPTERDRREILKIHLRNEQLAEDVKLDDLAKKTPFYSGSDLKNLAVAAALNAVKEENEAAKQHEVKQTEIRRQAGGESLTEESMGKHQYPAKRTLTAKHFERALEEITASISEDMSSLKDIKKFDEQYGDKRGRRRKKPMWGFKSATEAEKVLDTVKVRDA